jgi:hypothetical protein
MHLRTALFALAGTLASMPGCRPSAEDGPRVPRYTREQATRRAESQRELPDSAVIHAPSHELNGPDAPSARDDRPGTVPKHESFPGKGDGR